MKSELNFASVIGETFPDISDGSSMSIVSNRMTNLSKNYYKIIDNKIYIEIDGYMNGSIGTGGSYGVYPLLSKSLSLTITSSSEVELCEFYQEVPYYKDLTFGIRFFENLTKIEVIMHMYGSYNFSGKRLKVKAIVKP